jgi:hypothetical protein
MAPTGEACLVGYPDGRVWVSSIHTPPHQIEASDADQYIAAHDWTRLHRSFATWDALDNYRKRHATSPAEATPRIVDYDATEIRDVLDETSTADDPEQRASARLLLIDILRHALVVRTDDDLYAAVLARLEELTAPRRLRLSNRDPQELAVMMVRYAA